jgi:hypothetical protein
MNNTMVREIRGAKINPKSPFKKLGCAKYAGAEITRANTVIKVVSDGVYYNFTFFYQITAIAGQVMKHNNLTS